jgi:hypothetical protein
MADDDPYLMLGQKLVTALSLLGAKQTCKYVKKIRLPAPGLFRPEKRT